MIRGLSDIRYLSTCYRKAGIGARLHVYGRRILCPFPPILDHLPPDGCHLDAGCGHGILLALMRHRNPNQILKGIDVSQQKIEQAQQADFCSDISFEVCDIRQIGPGSFDSISVVDVLYLLTASQKLDFLSACHAALRPGGMFVVKEVSRIPGWKSLFTLAQEFIAVKVLRITMGEDIRFLSPQAMASLIAEAGFSPPEVKRIDGGYPYPHTLFSSRKTAA